MASWLAAEKSPGGLVLDSTFTRLADMPQSASPELRGLPSLLLGSTYNTLDRLKIISCPLLVIHSPEDRVVPFELGLKLYEAYEKGPKLMVKGRGGHMDFIFNHSEYTKALRAFLVVLPQTGQSSQ